MFPTVIRIKPEGFDLKGQPEVTGLEEAASVSACVCDVIQLCLAGELNRKHM